MFFYRNPAQVIILREKRQAQQSSMEPQIGLRFSGSPVIARQTILDLTAATSTHFRHKIACAQWNTHVMLIWSTIPATNFSGGNFYLTVNRGLCAFPICFAFTSIQGLGLYYRKSTFMMSYLQRIKITNHPLLFQGSPSIAWSNCGLSGVFWDFSLLFMSLKEIVWNKNLHTIPFVSRIRKRHKITDFKYFLKYMQSTKKQPKGRGKPRHNLSGVARQFAVDA